MFIDNSLIQKRQNEVIFNEADISQEQKGSFAKIFIIFLFQHDLSFLKCPSTVISVIIQLLALGCIIIYQAAMTYNQVQFYQINHLAGSF